MAFHNNNNNYNSQEFLDVSSMVLRDYIEFKIIKPQFQNSFIKFLDKKKKDLFHYLHSDLCCYCPHSNNKRQHQIQDKSNFFRLYKKITDRQIQCIAKRNHTDINGKVNKCICKYITIPNISIKVLDIPLLCVLLRVGNAWCKEADTIRETRHTVSHLPDSKSIDLQVWQKMETAVLHLASEINEFYYRLVQQRFEDIQTAHQRMSAYIEERLAEMRSEIQRGLGHIEEKVDVKIRNLRAEFHFQICHLDELVSNDEDNNERSKAIVELTATIENVPSTWNENQIVDNIAEGAANKGVATDDFQVVSAKQECIVLELRAPLSVFKDNETLQNALKTLLERIIRAGEIDDSVPSEVKIKITNRAISEPTFAAGPFANDEDAVDLSTINLPRIHFLLSIVLDIFPDILREWIAQDILTQKVETPIPLFELDLEGLYTEIKSAELNGARVSGSDSMAFATDTQIAADIDRMVYIQKQVCKRPNSVVSDEEWNDHLKDIFDIVNRFDKLMHKEKDSCYNRQTADLLISWTLAMQCSDGDSQDSYQMQLSNVNPQEIHWTNIEHWGEADERESFVGPLTNRTVSYSKGESSFVKSPLDNKKFNTAGSEYSVDSGLGSDEVKQKDKVSQEGDLKLSAIYSDKEKLLGRHMIKHRRSRKIVAIVDTYAKRKLFSAPAALSTVFSENPCYEANTTVQQTDKSEQNIGETVGDRKEPNEDLEVTHF